jgi:Integrase core domain
VRQRKRKRQRLGESTVPPSGCGLSAPTMSGPWTSSAGAERSFIEPGSPWQNPFVESFGSRVRDEVLSVETFDSATAGETPAAFGDRRSPAQPTPTRSGGWTDKRGPSPGSLLYQPTTEGSARPSARGSAAGRALGATASLAERFTID